MTDSFDEILERGGRVPIDDAEVRDAVAAMASAHARGRSRRRRIVSPAVSVGVLLAVAGTGAVAASQWAPWIVVTEPDIVIARDWTDTAGNALGSCETRLATEKVPSEMRDAAHEYLRSVNVDELEPNPESIAGWLTAVGVPEDFPRLVAGGEISDFDVTHQGPLYPREVFSDARIMQEALLHNVYMGMNEAMIAFGEPGGSIFESVLETQCTTDPVGGFQQ